MDNKPMTARAIQTFSIAAFIPRRSSAVPLHLDIDGYDMQGEVLGFEVADRYRDVWQTTVRGEPGVIPLHAMRAARTVVGVLLIVFLAIWIFCAVQDGERPPTVPDLAVAAEETSPDNLRPPSIDPGDGAMRLDVTRQLSIRVVDAGSGSRLPLEELTLEFAGGSKNVVTTSDGMLTVPESAWNAQLTVSPGLQWLKNAQIQIEERVIALHKSPNVRGLIVCAGASSLDRLYVFAMVDDQNPAPNGVGLSVDPLGQFVLRPREMSIHTLNVVSFAAESESKPIAVGAWKPGMTEVRIEIPTAGDATAALTVNLDVPPTVVAEADRIAAAAASTGRAVPVTHYSMSLEVLPMSGGRQRLGDGDMRHPMQRVHRLAVPQAIHVRVSCTGLACVHDFGPFLVTEDLAIDLKLPYEAELHAMASGFGRVDLVHRPVFLGLLNNNGDRMRTLYLEDGLEHTGAITAGALPSGRLVMWWEDPAGPRVSRPSQVILRAGQRASVECQMEPAGWLSVGYAECKAKVSSLKVVDQQSGAVRRLPLLGKASRVMLAPGDWWVDYVMSQQSQRVAVTIVAGKETVVELVP